MLEIILYIVLVIGVVYFVYLYRQKWNKVKEEDLNAAEISMKPVEKMFESTKVVTKKVFGKIKSVDKNKILSFFAKIKIKKIGEITRKVFMFLRERVKKIVVFVGRSLKKVFRSLKKKFSKKQNIDFITTRIENDQEKKENELMEEKIEKEVVPIEEAKKSLFKKFGKNNGKIDDKSKEILVAFSKKGLNLLSRTRKGIEFAAKGSAGGVKKIAKKIEIKKALILFRELVKKIKVRVVLSEEDKKLKKQLSQKRNITFKPEIFLGELLRKTGKAEEKKHVIEAESEIVSGEKKEVEQKIPVEAIKPEEENIVDKIEREVEEEIEKEIVEIAKPEVKNINPPSDQVSQETIQKIEDELIAQIVEDPKNIEAYKRLGKIYYNQDKFEYAKESFEMAIKLGSGDQKIKDLLKDCEDKIGK
ncbi:MAG: tetratricopeptide repeat protein [Candidatus Paceibacterota bacterium]|jgi:hypothetical protein